MTSYSSLPAGRSSAAVFPDFDAVNNASGLPDMVGALLTIVTVVAVLMLIVSAAGWALGQAHGNHRAVATARSGVWVALAAVVLAGGAAPAASFLLDLGSRL